MKLQIGTYGITFSLILSVLLSSCTSPYRILDSVHDCVHTVSSLFFGSHVHDHSHDLLDLLEKQQNDAQHNQYLLDSNNAKITNDIYILDISYKESKFSTIMFKVDDMLDSYFRIELYRPPIF